VKCGLLCWRLFGVGEDLSFSWRVNESCRGEDDQLCVSRCVKLSDLRNAACPIRPAVHVDGHPTTAAF
jgi:hypothetical protein